MRLHTEYLIYIRTFYTTAHSLQMCLPELYGSNQIGADKAKIKQKIIHFKNRQLKNLLDNKVKYNLKYVYKICSIKNNLGFKTFLKNVSWRNIIYVTDYMLSTLLKDEYSNLQILYFNKYHACQNKRLCVFVKQHEHKVTQPYCYSFGYVSIGFVNVILIHIPSADGETLIY